MAPVIAEIVPEAQSVALYDWGTLGKDGSKVAQLARAQSSFHYDENKPYAELWMGTHPSLPSRLTATGESLKAYISKNQDALGPRVTQHHGQDLPFLFKVLAIGKALSIQAHPDKNLAEKLHREKPTIYKDANHKPEMAIAVTSFSGLCGFRPLPEISKFLVTVPEFATVVGPAVSSAFSSAISPSSAEPKYLSSTQANASDLIPLQHHLKNLFSALMNAESTLVAEQVQLLVKRMSSDEENSQKFGTMEELVCRLNTQFPNDVGIFCVFMLNVVHLEPGQAAFLKANEPHAYLTGEIIECMATSDNVVRAGLTPKLRDVPTLTTMLTYTFGSASSQLMKPVKYKSCSYTTLYDPPIEEFSVLLTHLSAGQGDVVPVIDGPSILIVMEGKGSLVTNTDEKVVKVERLGQVYFISAGVQVEVKADCGESLVCYRAFVEAP